MNSLDAAQQQSLLMFDGAGWRPRRSWIHAALLDSRDVVRTYAMTLDAHNWTLLRDRADFTPLHSSQRFTGSFFADGNAHHRQLGNKR